MAEVDQETQAVAGGFQVIENLSAVLVRGFFDGFEFEDYLFAADEVCPIGLVEPLALIGQRKFDLAAVRNAPVGKLSFKAFLINSFQETSTHFAIDCVHRALDCIALFFIKDFLYRFGHLVGHFFFADFEYFNLSSVSSISLLS
jgi:hypothetical protein